MKLATYKSADSRDGRLVVVSRDLARAVDAGGVVPTLQAALDRWDAVAPRLAALSDALNAGQMDDTFPFDQAQAESPLPRAYQWLDGSSYLAHGQPAGPGLQHSAHPPGRCHSHHVPGRVG